MHSCIRICLLAATIGWLPITIAESPRGDAFSNSEHIASMPGKWADTPVSYPEELSDADLVISFGQQTFPALVDIVQEYARQHDLKIAVQSGTCGISAGKLLRKAIDMGAFCCPPGENDRLPGLEYHTIAISPIAVIVNQANPVVEITTEQARQIFQGRTQHWSHISADIDQVIKPVGRLHCKMRPGHWRLLLKEPELFSPMMSEVGVIPDLIAKVGQEANAISIETPFMLQRFDPDRQVKMLKLDGYAPTDLAYVASGQYPMYRTYSLTTWQQSDRRDSAMELVRHLQQHIEDNYEEYNFIPVSMLKKAGWKFRQDELIGEPSGKNLSHTPTL